MRVEGFGLRVEDLGFGVEDLGVGVKGLGLRFQNFRVEGCGLFRIHTGYERSERRNKTGKLDGATGAFYVKKKGGRLWWDCIKP